MFICTGITPSVAVDTVQKPSMSISNGNTLYVGGSGEGNYTKIQDAIDDASDGDTIFVFSGIYNETVIVNKAIELIGQNSLSTIIESSDIASIIWIKANDVIVKQFTIKADIQCICISSSRDNIISSNILTRYTSKLNRNSMLPDNGIDLIDSLNNTIINNSIRNRYVGVGLHNSSNNSVSMNTIKNCVACVYLEWFSNYNVINENEFIENNYLSIFISEESYNNYIYHNNIINCNHNAHDECSNTWDNGYPSGGNFWDDYNGIDDDGDGIGDTPYPIPGGDNEDRYPLMYPWGGNQPPEPPIIEGPPSGKPDIEYNYTFVTTDPDGDDVFYYIDWYSTGDGYWLGPYSSGEEVILPHTWPERGTFTISTKAKDIYGAESNWSEFEVSIPRNKSVYNSLFLWFLDRFPLLEVFLRAMNLLR